MNSFCLSWKKYLMHQSAISGNIIIYGNIGCRYEIYSATLKNINFIPEQVSLIATKSNIHSDWNLWPQSREEQHDLKQIYIDKIRKLNETPGARDSWFENSSTIIENWVRCTWNFETWWNPRKSFRVIVNFEPSWVMLMSLFH